MEQVREFLLLILCHRRTGASSLQRQAPVNSSLCIDNDMPRNRSPRRARRALPHIADTRQTQLEQRRRVLALLDDLDALLSRLLVEGEIDVDTSGAPIFRGPDGDIHKVAPSLNGMLCFFEIHQTRSRREMPIDAVLQLSNKLAMGWAIEHTHVAAARDALRTMRDEALRMSLDYASSLIRSAEIYIEMEVASGSTVIPPQLCPEESGGARCKHEDEV